MPAYPCGDPETANDLMSVELKGDVTGDRLVTFSDIPDFVQVLLGVETDARKLCAADMNYSGAANGRDIQLFVNKLLMP